MSLFPGSEATIETQGESLFPGSEGAEENVLASWEPGKHWMKPIDDEHPELGVWQRIKLKSLADTGPATLKLNLEKEGFEARHRGGMSFSIRKPGEKTWYVVDPSGFELIDDTLEFLGSIAPSTAGMIAATGKGAAAGATVGTAVPGIGNVAGGIVGGILGSGAGAAAGEAAKMGAGKLLGIEYAPEEVGKKIAMEAAFGAGGQAAAPLLGKLAGAGKRALMGEGKEVAMRNLAKQQAYKKAVAATPEGAPLPTAPVMEKVTQEGLIPAAGRKFKEARGAKTLLEAPERKTREAFAGGAEEIIEKAYKDVKEASLQDLTKKSRQLRQNIEKAAAKGKPTEKLQKRLKVVDEAREVDKALKKAAKANKGVPPATEVLTKESFIRQLAEDAGISTVGKAQEGGIVKALDNIITDEKFSEYLRFGQDPAVRDAMDAQIKGIIGSLDPEEEFFIKFARRGPKKKDVDIPPEDRFFREMDATRDIPFDAPGYRDAARDLEGKTLEEMRDILARAGWEGPVPVDLDEITEVLYRARQGIKGTGMSYDPQAYGLGGPPLKKGVGAVADVDKVATGEQPWREFGRAQVTDLEVGGKKVPIGRKLAEQQVEQMGPVQRSIAQPPGIARAAGRGLERLRRGTSKALGVAGDVAGVPGEAITTVGGKLARTASSLIGEKEGATLGGLGILGTAAYASGLSGAIGTTIGVGIVSKLAAGGLRKMSSAIMADPATLMAFMKKATGPVASKMQVPLQALQSRGQEAYKAAVFSLLHDPAVRGFLQDLERKESDE